MLFIGARDGFSLWKWRSLKHNAMDSNMERTAKSEMLMKQEAVASSHIIRAQDARNFAFTPMTRHDDESKTKLPLQKHNAQLYRTIHLLE